MPKKTKKNTVEPVEVAPATDMIPQEHKNNLDPVEPVAQKVDKVIKQKSKLKKVDIFEFDPQHDQVEYSGMTQQDVDDRFARNLRNRHKKYPPSKDKYKHKKDKSKK